MYKINFENVKNAKGGQLLPAGNYVCHVVDVFENGYDVLILFDIHEGEYKEYFDFVGSYSYMKNGNQYDYPSLQFTLDPGEFEEHLRFSKFIEVAEKANPNFKFNGSNLDEIELIGLTLETVDYANADGTIETHYRIVSIDTPDNVRCQERGN